MEWYMETLSLWIFQNLFPRSVDIIVVQSRKAVTSYLKSEPLLRFACAEHNSVTMVTYPQINPYGAGIDFRRQNLTLTQCWVYDAGPTSTQHWLIVRFWRLI